MTEIILALIITALLGGLIYERRENTKLVKELTAKIKAGTLSEFTINEAKKPLGIEDLNKAAAKDDDLVDMDTVSDDVATEAALKTADQLRNPKKEGKK